MYAKHAMWMSEIGIVASIAADMIWVRAKLDNQGLVSFVKSLCPSCAFDARL